MITPTKESYEKLAGNVFSGQIDPAGWSLCACSCTPYACPSSPCNACSCICPPGSCSCGCSCTCPKCKSGLNAQLDW